MRGDFTRDTRERARRAATRAVLLQQGRPLTDADINEQSGLVADRSEAIVRHLVGHHGAPRDDAGFAITPIAGGFSIGPGTIYAEGLPVTNRAEVSYDAQFAPGILPTLASVIPDDQEALIYLEVVLHPAMGADLADPGLDGVETVTREVAGWAVRVAPLAGIGMARDALIEALDRNQPVDIAPWRETTGGLDADVDMQNPDPGPCEIAASAGYLDQLNRLYRVEIHAGGAPGTATFKWTEDAACEAGLRAMNTGFAIDLPQVRVADWFKTGTVVEVIDEERARAGLTGPMGPITSAPGAPLIIDGVPASALNAAVRVRRWATMPLAVPPGAAWSALSKGVRVRFSAGEYRTGAAWTIPARTVLGDIVWPPYPGADRTETVAGQNVDFYAPLEGRRYHAALALVRRNRVTIDDDTTDRDTITHLADLREVFPPLTDLTAGAIRYDNGTSGLEATDVQQAIDELVERIGDCCTWHVRPSFDLQAVIDSIPSRANGTVCLATGNYKLAQPLRIIGKGHIRVIGSGRGSKLWRRNGASALMFEDCLSVEVADLTIAAEAPGVPEKLKRTAGAVDIIDSGRVRVARATLIARGRRWRQSTALRIACSAKPGGGDVVVDDCDMVVGDLASGVIVLNSRTCRIENNRIRPRAEPLDKTLDRWAEDRTMAAAVGRLVVGHTIERSEEGRRRPPTRRDARVFPEYSIDIGQAGLTLYSSALVDPSAFKLLSELLVAESRLGGVRRHSLRMRELVSSILVHKGRLIVAGKPFDGFMTFYNAVRQMVAPTIDSAIVVAGDHAGDVTVAGNSIEGALRGVRVAVSGAVLGTVRVDRNRIRLRVVPADIVRFGIYLGNAERCWIVDNDIASETADPEFSGSRKQRLLNRHYDALYAEGVHVGGILGPMIQIRGNIVRDCSFAYTVSRADGTDGRPKLWLLQGNYADGAVTPYRLDNACESVNSI